MYSLGLVHGRSMLRAPRNVMLQHQFCPHPRVYRRVVPASDPNKHGLDHVGKEPRFSYTRQLVHPHQMVVVFSFFVSSNIVLLNP